MERGLMPQFVGRNHGMHVVQNSSCTKKRIHALCSYRNNGVYMTPEELKPIVEAHGGPELFAPLIGVKPRIVYYWLRGERNMEEPTEKLIRTLKPKRSRT